MSRARVSSSLIAYEDQPQTEYKRIEIEINEGATATVPLELSGLGIDNEWNEVVGTSVQKYREFKQMQTKIMCCAFACVCFIFCIVPWVIYKLSAEEKKLGQWIVDKCEEVNKREHLRGRVQFSSSQQEEHIVEAYAHHHGDHHHGGHTQTVRHYWIMVTYTVSA